MVKRKAKGMKLNGWCLGLSIVFIIFFVFTLWTVIWFDERLDNLEDYTWKNQISSWKCVEWKIWDQMQVLENGDHIKTGEEKRCSKEMAVRESPNWGLIA